MRNKGKKILTILMAVILICNGLMGPYSNWFPASAMESTEEGKENETETETESEISKATSANMSEKESETDISSEQHSKSEEEQYSEKETESETETELETETGKETETESVTEKSTETEEESETEEATEQEKRKKVAVNVKKEEENEEEADEEKMEASEEYIYFDLAAGDVKINGNSYTGYIYETTTTDNTEKKEITGTNNTSQKYYIYQSDSSNRSTTGLVNNKMVLPVYSGVTCEGKAWGDYITNNQSVEDVIQNWATEVKNVGREGTEHKIEIKKVTCEVVFDNLYSTYYVPNSAFIDKGPVEVSPSGNQVTLKIRGDNRFNNICYDNMTKDNGKLIIDSYDGNGQSSGTLTVAPLKTEQGYRTIDSLAVIGMGGFSEYGLTFSGATVFAGIPSQYNNVWNDRNDVAFMTCIGGGVNQPGEVTITGGRLTAVSNGTATAIGGGAGYEKSRAYGDVTISGGEVYAYSRGVYSVASNYQGYVPATTIGGGATFTDIDFTNSTTTTVTITGGYVYAESVGGTAIGGGNSRNKKGGDATVSISGNATVVAKSIESDIATAQDGSSKMHVSSGTAIGGGFGKNGGKGIVTITGGTVTATAIGGGSAIVPVGETYSGNGGAAEITISGGTLVTGTIGGGTTEHPGTDAHIGYATATISGGDITGQFLLRGDKGSSESCNFTMTGGTIHDTDASDSRYKNRKENGGALWMDDDDGTVTISGGTIETCSATMGGAIYMTGGTVTVNGGTIRNNQAENQGGAIYIGKGSFQLDETAGSSVLISGNQAAQDGGGLYIKDGDVTLKGGTIQKNKAAGGSGGGIYASGGTVTLESGSVVSNTAKENGGGIAVEGTKAEQLKVEAQGITLRDNTVTEGNGGGLYVEYGNFTLANGTIKGNKANNWNILNQIANGNGGGIYVKNGTLTMSGGVVEENECSRFGGGIYIWAPGEESNLQGGEIRKNKAGQCGGGVTLYQSNALFSRNDDGSGVHITENMAVDGGGVYARWHSKLIMEGGSISGNRAISLEDLSQDGEDFFQEVKELYGTGTDNNQTSLRPHTNSGAASQDFGGNGGGIFIHNSELELSGTAGKNSGDIRDNVAERNGGGVYGFHSVDSGSDEGTDDSDSSGSKSPLVIKIENGNITGNTAGLHGGGVAMFAMDCNKEPVYIPTTSGEPTAVSETDELHEHTQAAISGQASISNNTAANGGAFYIGGGKLDVSGGIIKGNQAVGKPENSVTTAYDPDKNVGVGGGIYTYRTGQLNLVVNSKKENEGNLGVFSNVADFAADDIYCSPASTSKISLPAVNEMTLLDYENHVIGKADSWYEDYPTGDTSYSKGLNGKSENQNVVRYRDAEKKNKQDQVRYEITDDPATQELNKYTCLTLGYSYTRINLTLEKEVAGKDEENNTFQFEVTIDGKISEEEKKLNYNQPEKIFNPSDAEYTIEDDGSGNGSNSEVAKVTLSLKKGESVTLEGIPVNAKVIVTETTTIKNDGTTEDVKEKYTTTYTWGNISSTGESYTMDNVGDEYSTVTCTNAVGISETASISVWACEEDSEPSGWKKDQATGVTSDEPNQVTLDLASLGIEEEQLKGKKFTLTSVTDGISLADCATVDGQKRTAGSYYANHTFGMTMKTDQSEVDVAELSGQGITFTVDKKITFQLHNANAITENSDAGTLSLKLKSDNDELNVTITIHREPAQINATVPLYVCMYGYGIDGKILTPSKGTYAITNQSNCPIQITAITGRNGEWTLTKSYPSKEEQLRLTIGDRIITTDEQDTSKDEEWKIEAPTNADGEGVSLYLEIQAAMAGESANNQEGEVNACTVTYVTKIAE